MASDVIHQPEQPHVCQVGCETYELSEGDPLRELGYVGVNPFAHRFDPAGTVRQCGECGRRWTAVAFRQPGRLGVEWVPESRLARWWRERRKRKADDG